MRRSNAERGTIVLPGKAVAAAIALTFGLAPPPAVPQTAPAQREQDAYTTLMKTVAAEAWYTPVLYLQPPARSMDQRNLLKRAGVDIGVLDHGPTSSAMGAVDSLVKAFGSRKEVLRAAFLPSGYFFTPNGEIVNPLYRRLRFDMLFDAERIVLCRGGTWTPLEKRGSFYYRPGANRRELLLFNDLVAGTQTEVAALKRHLDLYRFQEDFGFERLEILGLSPRGLDLRLHYPGGQAFEGHLDKTLSFVPGEPTETWANLVKQRRAFFAFAEQTRKVVAGFVSDGVFFDEPRGERLVFDPAKGKMVQEQLDGMLRINWRKAYFKSKDTYSFRDDTYPVFAANGNPLPPQVCIDFVFDAYETAGGSVYRKRGEPPGKTAGSIDLSSWFGVSRETTRSVPNFLDMAKDKKAYFDLFTVPHLQRVAYKHPDFYPNLFRLIDDGMALQPLDILVLHGPTKGAEFHYHTGLVSRVDPLTGFPTEIMENPGHARFSRLGKDRRPAPDTFLGRTERRWIRARVRPRFDARHFSGELR